MILFEWDHYQLMSFGVQVLVEAVLSLVLSGVRYHESRWPYFLDWGYQMLFHLGSVLLFGIVVSFG